MTVVSSRTSGKEYANIKIRCGDRAISFDPSHVDDLVDGLSKAKALADSEKQRLILERTPE